MALEIFLIIASAICLLVGLAGCILPLLPGPPISYVGLLLLHFTGKVHFSTTQLVVWAIVVVAIVVLDYLTPVIGTKRFGGSKYGNRGCLAGTFVGLCFLPWGIVVGPFAGAVIGELIGKRPFKTALKAGFGSFVGFLFGTLLKLAVCLYFIFCFFTGIFQ